MTHAIPDVEFCDDHVEAASGILGRCAGLPIALAVAGEAIALRVNAGLRFGTACKTYCDMLSDAMHGGVSVLDAAISLSLDSLQDCATQDGRLNTSYTLREMYFSLCVLRHQQQARVSVLHRMWKVDESAALEICVRFSSMSLSKLSSGGVRKKKKSTTCGSMTYIWSTFEEWRGTQELSGSSGPLL